MCGIGYANNAVQVRMVDVVTRETNGNKKYPLSTPPGRNSVHKGSEHGIHTYLHNAIQSGVSRFISF